MTDTPHILVVDDDAGLRRLLAKYLHENGYRVTTAEHAEDARHKLSLFLYDLIVLDVMMPHETGIELLTRLPAPHAPVLMLTAMGEGDDRIRGLESGADDYLTKPFEPRELVLRIENILRRVMARKQQAEKLRFGEFEMDVRTGKLTQKNMPVYLTFAESELLRTLAESQGEPVTREELARRSGFETDNERTVDVQINRLRKKIEANPGKPVYIQTVRNAGYSLQVDP